MAKRKARQRTEGEIMQDRVRANNKLNVNMPDGTKRTASDVLAELEYLKLDRAHWCRSYERLQAENNAEIIGLKGCKEALEYALGLAHSNAIALKNALQMERGRSDSLAGTGRRVPVA